MYGESNHFPYTSHNFRDKKLSGRGTNNRLAFIWLWAAAGCCLFLNREAERRDYPQGAPLSALPAAADPLPDGQRGILIFNLFSSQCGFSPYRGLLLFVDIPAPVSFLRFDGTPSYFMGYVRKQLPVCSTVYFIPIDWACNNFFSLAR